VALVAALLMNGVSYWFSDKIILAVYGAHEVSREDAPRLYAIVERLAERAQLPMPKVCIMENDSPNAFATGRNPQHAAVAVTTGILRLLDEEELAGVIGHELAHVKNRDILTGTVVATIAGAITFIAYMAPYFMGGGRDGGRRNNPLSALLLMILAPIVATLIQFAISRTREYSADRGGADISGNPRSLAGALRKLTLGTQHAPMDAGPATAHMFIVNPFSGRGMLSIFSTHPPVEQRIDRLQKMAEQSGAR